MVIREELSKRNQVAYCRNYSEIISTMIRDRIAPDQLAPKTNMALAIVEELLDRPYAKVEWALDQLTIQFEADSQVHGHAKNLRTAISTMIERERSHFE